MVHTVEDSQLARAAAFDPAAALANPDRQVLMALPTIDIAPFVGDSSRAERERVAAEIRRASIDLGFFYVTGHGIDRAELAGTLASGHRFFELPFAEKMKIAARNSPANLGFIQTGGLNPEDNPDKNPDLKERLYLSRALAPGEALDEASPAGRSQWPEETVLPGFRPAMEAATARMVALARAMSRAFGLSLGLPEDALERYHDRMGCIHSFNYYPPTTATQEQAWGFSPHTDYGSFTILLQDESGGLQTRNAAGDWVEVPPVPDTFVVNVGDLLARWTNDLYVSALHRVINRGTEARLSVSFFAYANPRAEIATLETCISPARPSRYEPVIAGDYIRELLTQAYRTGRSGMSARTAGRL